VAARGEAGCAQGLGAAAVLLCGAYVLRCVCEGLLFDGAASFQALHPNCNGVREGSRDGPKRAVARRTTWAFAPSRAPHQHSACRWRPSRMARWPSASGCARQEAA